MVPTIKELLEQPGWELAREHYDSTGGFIEDDDPWRFLGKFLGAIDNNKPVFLAKTQELPGFDNYIMIPTSGTTGEPKLAMHTWENIVNSVCRTCRALNVKKIHSICLLPLNHVSGLMAVMRAFISGGTVRFTESGIGGYVSLVPTQLKRYLDKDYNWLKNLDGIFLGGDKADKTLLEKARDANLNIINVYGSTETMAMVIMNGKTMPGVNMWLENNKVNISTDSLFYGYYPNTPQEITNWEMGDFGEIKDNTLVITGRSDDIIITGGKKVSPRKVEKIILQSGLVDEVIVKGEADPEWGSRVVAHCKSKNYDEFKLKAYCKKHLEKHEVPKVFYK